jgi:hypothetical protein
MGVERKRLPNRHYSEVFEFEHNGQTYTVGLGYDCDVHGAGSLQLGEVFLDCGKSGTDAQLLARDNAVTLSLWLQHGIPTQGLRHAMTRLRDDTGAGVACALLDRLAAEGLVS